MGGAGAGSHQAPADKKPEERKEEPRLTGIAARSKASSVLFETDYSKSEKQEKTPWWKRNQH